MAEHHFRENIKEKIGLILYEEGFASNRYLANEITDLVDLVSDYKEEGKSLFPEFIIFDKSTDMQMIPGPKIDFGNCTNEHGKLKHIAKLCSPLTAGRWSIYVIPELNQIKYGLINPDISDMSPSLYKQMKQIADETEAKFLLIRQIAQQKIEVLGRNNSNIFNLSLRTSEIGAENLENLAKEITKACSLSKPISISSYFEKNLDSAIKDSHGTLVGVINDDQNDVNSIKEIMQGHYFEPPISLQEIIEDANSTENGEATANLRAYTSLFISLFANDGIVILTNTAKIIGYHLFISVGGSDTSITGGARSRAYQSMIDSNKFIYCYYRSQDGNTKGWNKNV